MHRSARGNPVEIEVEIEVVLRWYRAKNLGLISGHPADPAARLPPPRHMLPHLLTLTRAAVPGLTLIHPDSHLLGKKQNFEKVAREKNVEILDLVKGFPTHIWSQKSASIQPRTDRLTFEIGKWVSR